MAVVLIVNFAFAPLISVLFNWVTNNNSNVENFFHPIPYVYVNSIEFELKIFLPIYFLTAIES